MKFISIRQKLIKAVSVIFVVSFVLVLSIVAYMNTTDSHDNLAKTEESIKNSLIAKARTLVNNNSQALKGMAEDNAFIAVKELVSSTVNEDSDIVYGIFMDADLMPWVSANADNIKGDVNPGEELSDEASIWAASLEKQDFKVFEQEGGDSVYEFAAPVIVDDEILGTIRYGFSTGTMREAVRSATEAAEKSLQRTLMILVATVIVALIIGVLSTRKVAKTMTTPLSQLEGAAGTIAQGNYDTAVTVKTNDEIGRLASNFEKMRTTIQKKMADLAKLNSTGEVLASLLDQDKALEVVFQTMHEQIGVSLGSVYLTNDQDEFEVKAYFPPKKTENNKQSATKFVPGEGVLGRAAKQKEIVYVPDTHLEESFKSSGDAPSKALLCVPLLDKDILIGVMNLSGAKDEVHFEESDYEFVSSVARLLVITIKNIRMREVIEEQNRTLEQKVEARTAELAQKNNDISNMMSNMHQGLFTIMEGGIVHHEYAAYLEAILETSNIANRNFMDLLFTGTDLGADTLDQVKTAIDSLIGCDEMMYDFNSHLLATEVTKTMSDGREKILELDWDPIIFEEEIDKIMVTVRDVTELKALEKAAAAQKEELEIIGQILAVGEQKYSEFLTSSFDFITKCRESITNTKEKDLEVIAGLFRWMHTVKGNARTYGFTYITNSVHEVESHYDELRKIEEKAWQPEILLKELQAAEDDVNRYANIGREKLGMGGSSEASASAAFDMEEVVKILDRIQNIDTASLHQDVKGVLKDSYALLLSAQAKPISKVIGGVLESVESLAVELEKPVPTTNIDDGGVYVEAHAHSMMNNIFMHVFRNALDHGIEGPQERTDAGKTEAGTIQLQVENHDDNATFTIADDGRGLAVGKIFEKAVEKGLYEESNKPSDVEIANLIFASGFSTAEQVTEVSGRGVGMDAVKKFLESEGGGIDIALTDDNEGANFRQFKTVITLPSAFYKTLPDFL